MSNQDTKKKLNIWLDVDTVADIDTKCKEQDITRAALVRDAIKQYLTQERNTTELQLALISEKVEKIEEKQRTQTAAILQAIQEQPVQVLPSSKPTLREKLFKKKQKIV